MSIWGAPREVRPARTSRSQPEKAFKTSAKKQINYAFRKHAKFHKKMKTCLCAAQRSPSWGAISRWLAVRWAQSPLHRSGPFPGPPASWRRATSGP